MKKKEILWDIYQSLNPEAKQICQIMAVYYEAITDAILLDLLTKLNAKTEEGTKFTIEKVLFYRRFLEKNNLALLTKKKDACIIDRNVEKVIFRDTVLSTSFFLPLAEMLRKPPYDEYLRYNSSFDKYIKAIRIAYTTGKIQEAVDLIERVRYTQMIDWNNFNFNDYFFKDPFDPNWLNVFSIQIHENVLIDIIVEKLNVLGEIQELVDVLNSPVYTENKSEELRRYAKNFLALIYAYIGNFNAIKQNTTDTNHALYYGLNAIVSFLTGNDQQAIALFEQYLKVYRKEQRSTKIYPATLAGMSYLLLLLKNVDAKTILFIEDAIDRVNIPQIKVLKTMTLLLKNNLPDAINLLKNTLSNTDDAMTKLIGYFCAYWLGNDLVNKYEADIKLMHTTATKNQYHWVVFEVATLLGAINNNNKLYAENAKQLSKQFGFKSIIDCYQPQEAWQVVLHALSMIDEGGTSKNTRLVWFVSFDNPQIQGYEQVILKSGGWSAGKVVSLGRISQHDIPCMTQQDHQIARYLRLTGESGYGKAQYMWDYGKAFMAMVQHPLLFLNGTNIELIQAEPELIIEEKNGNYEMKFSTTVDKVGVNITKETSTRYRLTHVTSKHLLIVNAMGGESVKIPAKAKQKLTEITTTLANIIAVNSPLIQENENIPTLPTDERIYVQLIPYSEGLRAELYVKPFATQPPYSKPGEGSSVLMSKMDNKSVKTLRNLDTEKANQKEIVDNCPLLLQNNTHTNEWIFDEVEEALELLIQLEPFALTNKIVIEWPKGERFRLKYQLGFKNLSLRINRQKDWFNLEGQLRIGNQDVMDMRELLELIDTSNKRFIELNDGSFLALTKEFRRRLQDIKAYTDKKGKDLRFHPLAAFALEDFANKADNLDADKHWKQQISKLKNIKKHNPQVPSTLQADLRHYQIEGFTWLSQMAFWGVGACLADDMGLGKTLQALAVMVERADKGPALVVAPSSVCQNWINEVNKFAPTINPILFSGSNRQATINELKPFDLLVCSYTLMQQEADMLSKVKFNMTVLDEAQAIKNQNTKRSKAAMDLNSDFKVITTGTPIENHLGELWNLFNFINPGLLGSAQSFSEKYAAPIEKYDDQERRQQLQRLIKPFVLRRRKNQVLDELPSKTEITLSVELSSPETAFYEAIRQNAVEKLEQLKDQNQGTQHLQILAEIMRLRQAACNTQLVNKDVKIPSAKLSLFSEVVQELLDNGHKALVFSQFVGHLRLIEQRVKEMGISYQYLDGQTPVATRQTLVDEFQKGNGDLFLISLKAGGVGLNLTAADYVIIMDPWWNPAVEDQAADRAHRIGQQRPVTIYRLVTQNTIEEKIIQLHSQKRDLADSLLEGTEGSAKLSAKELLALMQKG